MNLRIGQLLLIICTVLIIEGCSRGPKTRVPIDPESQMVVCRIGINQTGADEFEWSYFVSRIDLKTNQMIFEAEIPEEAFQLTELSSGGVLISFCSAPGTFQKKMGLVDERGRYRKFLKKVDPSSSISFRDISIVIRGGESSGPLDLEWVTDEGASLRNFNLHRSAMLNREGISFNRDSGQLLMVLDTYPRIKNEFFEKSIPILLETSQGTFAVLKNWPYDWTSPSIFIIPSTNILLVGPKTDDRIREAPPKNVVRRIDVRTFPDFKLIKEIPLRGMVWEITHAPNQDKAYVRFEDVVSSNTPKDGIAVIDLKTNRLIKYLEYPSASMRYVGMNRLAFTTWDWVVTPDPKTGMTSRRRINHRLMILDTTTDKVLVQFKGFYDKVGYDAGLETGAYR